MLDLPVHSRAFRVRRVLNWLPLGLAYAFLYMGRYNLTVAKNALGDLMTKAEFGEIFGLGAIVYGCAFVVNGPLTDRIGGRRTMLIGVLGSIVMNLLMGLVLLGAHTGAVTTRVAPIFMFLYAVNMYFQSFGAVAIVTVKAPWFHIRERGTFSTIFGVMISMGVYFAFDWGQAIVDATRGATGAELGALATGLRALGLGGAGVDQNWWLFFIPSLILGVLWLTLLAFLRNTPSDAGYADFDTGEGSVSHDGERLPIRVIFLRLLSHPVLSVICLIELCSGVLRNGVMHWYTFFAKETGFAKEFFVTQNWGLMLLIAGIVGSVLTGWASDRFFQSRRAPMAGILYGLMLLATIAMSLGLSSPHWVLGAAVLLVSMSVIGVHGIMSGTSTVDFGGTKNGGAAVGIVDGLVYLGTAMQAFAAGYMTPTGEAAKDPANWIGWPLFLVPFAIAGVILSARIWNALPRSRAAAAPPSEPAASATKIAALTPGGTAT
ncbi:MAG: MFS transporter [Deltaproteobacteria bacterium]|nr:MFS transporter [Deltaproteobacteria bacterium]